MPKVLLIAEQIANLTIAMVNQFVRPTTDNPYAQQAVLESVIRILQNHV